MAGWSKRNLSQSAETVEVACLDANVSVPGPKAESGISIPDQVGQFEGANAVAGAASGDLDP